MTLTYRGMNFWLRRAVEDELSTVTVLDGCAVTVRVRDGVVLLVGEVPSPTLAGWAVETAERIRRRRRDVGPVPPDPTFA